MRNGRRPPKLFQFKNLYARTVRFSNENTPGDKWSWPDERNWSFNSQPNYTWEDSVYLTFMVQFYKYLNPISFD